MQLIDVRDLWTRMWKSLGEKRKEISNEHIEEITQLYGEFTKNKRVKIFPNEVFGYQRITVELPLRIRWEVNSETIIQLTNTKQWTKLSPSEQAQVSEKLFALIGFTTLDYEAMSRAIEQLPKTIEKSLWNVLAVPDPDAPSVVNKKGAFEPDSNLRDYENVPFPDMPVTWVEDPKERLESLEYLTAIDNYMTREVLPYVSEAWVDHSKTKIGYEIPFNRYFYSYIPPRKLVDIDAEVKMLDEEIQNLMGEVMK